jgi:predicted transcriptional regulator
MGKTIDIEIQKQIPILYSQLKSKKKVAEELGISVATVSKYLNLLEAGGSSERKPRTKITTELIEQINNLYTNCGNMT